MRRRTRPLEPHEMEKVRVTDSFSIVFIGPSPAAFAEAWGQHRAYFSAARPAGEEESADVPPPLELSPATADYAARWPDSRLTRTVTALRRQVDAELAEEALRVAGGFGGSSGNLAAPPTERAGEKRPRAGAADGAAPGAETIPIPQMFCVVPAACDPSSSPSHSEPLSLTMPVPLQCSLDEDDGDVAATAVRDARFEHLRSTTFTADAALEAELAQAPPPAPPLALAEEWIALCEWVAFASLKLVALTPSPQPALAAAEAQRREGQQQFHQQQHQHTHQHQQQQHQKSAEGSKRRAPKWAPLFLPSDWFAADAADEPTPGTGRAGVASRRVHRERERDAPPAPPPTPYCFSTAALPSFNTVAHRVALDAAVPPALVSSMAVALRRVAARAGATPGRVLEAAWLALLPLSLIGGGPGAGRQAKGEEGRLRDVLPIAPWHIPPGFGLGFGRGSDGDGCLREAHWRAEGARVAAAEAAALRERAGDAAAAAPRPLRLKLVRPPPATPAASPPHSEAPSAGASEEPACACQRCAIPSAVFSVWLRRRQATADALRPWGLPLLPALFEPPPGGEDAYLMAPARTARDTDEPAQRRHADCVSLMLEAMRAPGFAALAAAAPAAPLGRPLAMAEAKASVASALAAAVAAMARALGDGMLAACGSATHRPLVQAAAARLATEHGCGAKTTVAPAHVSPQEQPPPPQPAAGSPPAPAERETRLGALAAHARRCLAALAAADGAGPTSEYDAQLAHAARSLQQQHQQGRRDDGDEPPGGAALTARALLLRPEIQAAAASARGHM